jgi:hypothetical protein
VYWSKSNGVFTLWYGKPFGYLEPIFYEENEWTENNFGEIDDSENDHLGEILTYDNITHWANLPQPPKEKL